MVDGLWFYGSRGCISVNLERPSLAHPVSDRTAKLTPMKTIELWRWRILWLGRWKKTRHHATEEEIRREHPEAERVPGSMLLSEVADTEEERRVAMFRPRRVE